MMTLKSDKTGQAEYDRFLDLMAKLNCTHKNGQGDFRGMR